MDDRKVLILWISFTTLLYAVLFGMNFIPENHEMIEARFPTGRVHGLPPVVYVILLETLAFLPCVPGFYQFTRLIQAAEDAGYHLGHGVASYFRMLRFALIQPHLLGSLVFGVLSVFWYAVVGLYWASWFVPARG